MGVRLICNYGLIDFGFHTSLIWLIFVVVAIMYNRLPALQSTVSIMLSGVLIVVTEVITALALTIILGTEEFNAMMDNTATVEGQITRAAYGIPMNMLFVLAALLLYYLIKKRNERRAAKTENA